MLKGSKDEMFHTTAAVEEYLLVASSNQYTAYRKTNNIVNMHSLDLYSLIDYQIILHH
jgi:hypothetical protein